MRIGRTILVALVALSVAMLPVAAGMARAMAHDASVTSHADCCPNDQPCEKKTDRCGSDAACVLNCFSLTGVVAAPFALALTATALERPALAMQTLRSPAENPPLPPPRV